MVQPPALRRKSLTLDDDWLVRPAPDVVDTMVPVPSMPVISGPDVVTVDVPPRNGSGQVSPTVVVVEAPLMLITDAIPVALPLYSEVPVTCACETIKVAMTMATLIQIETNLSFPMFIGVLL